ncbi:MAG: hypothetical protein OEL54_06655 [Flavobacteriaceae bacterium]|nr:hypothetical protein [Flavobacteriaceae bacterium]
MSEENCYLCQDVLKKGQSFYEGHGVKVCLACYRVAGRCQKCKFPSNSLQRSPAEGDLCEFCFPASEKNGSQNCFICDKVVLSEMSHYADYGKVVCQSCFKDSKIRCFICRFPKVQEILPDLGGVCEFCNDSLISRDTELESMIKPLMVFVKSFNHQIVDTPNFKWIDWKIILGMQKQNFDLKKIHFFDELIQYCYPVFYMNKTIFVIPKIKREWFMPYLAGQIVAKDLCEKYQLPHLIGNSPFHQLARGWCHWIILNTAQALKFKQVEKKVNRFPDPDLMGNFFKFQAMTEFRKHAEVIEFGHKNLEAYAGKYL